MHELNLQDIGKSDPASCCHRYGLPDDRESAEGDDGCDQNGFEREARVAKADHVRADGHFQYTLQERNRQFTAEVRPDPGCLSKINADHKDHQIC